MAEFSLPNFLAGLAVAGLAAGGFAAAAGAFGTSPAQSASAQAAPALPAKALPASTPGRLAPLPTTEELRAAGISDPISIERDDGLIEVEHRDSTGRRIETRLHPATRAVVSQRADHDDRDGERDDD